jgi:hypothetical protein
VRMAPSYVLTHARLARAGERSALTQRSFAAWRQRRADSSPIAAKPVITNPRYAATFHARRLEPTSTRHPDDD